MVLCRTFATDAKTFILPVNRRDFLREQNKGIQDPYPGLKSHPTHLQSVVGWTFDTNVYLYFKCQGRNDPK